MAKRTVASARVRGEWLRRVEAEYRSASIAQHLGLWLIQIGASPDLIRMCMRIANDEIVHADLSHRAFVAAGGEGGPTLARETLELPRRAGDPLELDVLRVCVDVFCLGETVAVPLFAKLRAGCTVPAARRVLDRVLRDEVRHRDFGWTLLAWLFEHPAGPAFRAVVERELPQFFARVRSTYAPAAAARESAIDAEDRAWGLMPAAQYGDVLRRTFERDWVPRFKKLGVDAKSAWEPRVHETMPPPTTARARPA